MENEGACAGKSTGGWFSGLVFENWEMLMLILMFKRGNANLLER